MHTLTRIRLLKVRDGHEQGLVIILRDLKWYYRLRRCSVEWKHM